MLSHASPVEGANSLELYLKKFHSVFAMHKVAFGSPEHFPRFVSALRDNRHLAMDFWALTAAIHRNEGDLPIGQMLDIITYAVTGKNAADLRDLSDEQKQAVTRLTRLLGGEDLDNPLSEPEEPWPPKRTESKLRPVSVFSRVEAVMPAKFAEAPAPENTPVEDAAEQSSAPNAAEEKYASESTANESFASAPIENTAGESASEVLQPSQAMEQKPAAEATHASQAAEESAVESPLARTPAEGKSSPEIPAEKSTVPEEKISPMPDEADSTPAVPKWQRETDLRDDLPSSASPTLSRRAIDEALQRLELNSRQLKRLLAEIDFRMRRIEVTSKASPPKPASVVEPVPAFGPSEPDLSFDAMAHRLPRATAESPRLVLKTEDGEIPGVVPFENYTDRTRGLGNAGWFVLLLLLGGSIFAVQHWYGGVLPDQFGSSMQQVFHRAYDEAASEVHTAYNALRKKFQSPAPPSSSGNSAGPVSSGSPASATVTNRESTPPATTQTKPAAENTPPSAPAPAPAAPPSQPAPSGLTVSDARGTEPVRPNRPLPTDGEYTSARASLDSSEMPVNVPASVMQENLVTSRVPAYPEAARADGVEGPVVMQALISKRGTVDRLHVIQGDPLLRGAASQAVSKWQYRPYTVNGHPVEVATTVRVEFKLPRR